MNNPVMMTDPDGRQHRFAQAFESSPDFNNNPQKYLIGAGGRSDMWNMLNNGAPVVNNNGLSNSLINTMLSQGNGTWSNTGYSFDSDSHVSLGYNGSYRSLNTTLDKYIDIPEVVLKGRSFTWGQQIFTQFNSYMNEWSAHQAWDDEKLALDIGGGLYGALETAARPGNQWLGKNGKYYNNSWGGNQYTGCRSGAYKAASNYKWAGRAALGVSAVIGGIETYNGYYMDGGQFGYNAQSAAFGSAGSLIGGYYGGLEGAAAGLAFGVIFGPPGLIIGPIIGGGLGGLGGGYIGGQIGEGVINLYHDR